MNCMLSSAKASRCGVSIRVEPVQPRSCRPRSSAKDQKNIWWRLCTNTQRQRRCNITAAYARVRAKMTLIR